MSKDIFDIEAENPNTPKKSAYSDLEKELGFDLSFLDDIDESVLPKEEPKPRKKAPVQKSAPASATRKAAPAASAAEAPKKPPVKKAPEGQAPVKKSPAPQQGTPAPKKTAPKPVQSPEPPKTQKKKQKKGPRVGGIIFYTLYFMFILIFFVATYFGLQWVHGWLTDYELSQPTVKAEQVFREVFTDPDWAALYESAGAQDSPYEGKSEYVTYMEKKVGSQSLTYLETSAGLAKNTKKYNVLLDSEKVASFTLVDRNTVGSLSLDNLENITDIPDWQLGAVEVFFQREETYSIVKLDGHTAYVNGVALSDDFTIQIATTKAVDYLPAGATGASMCTQQITGLMEVPTVVITDKDGNEMPVVYDENKQTFTERTESNTMTQEQKERAIETGKTYCLYMIEEINDRTKIAKYFDSSSEIYSTIIGMYSERWMQNNAGYEFRSAEVEDFAAYGDDLFSARVILDMVVTRNDGTTRSYPFDSTLFFQKNGSGKWMCFNMVNVDVSQPVGRVRLTFMQGDTLLTSGYVDTDAKQVVTPNISVPAGQVLTGWVTISAEEDGTQVYNLVFQPDETGVVAIPDGTTLTPMTLYALVQDASEVATATE